MFIFIYLLLWGREASPTDIGVEGGRKGKSYSSNHPRFFFSLFSLTLRLQQA